ncbi:hypothetical protein MHYP_G00199410 [Metynnis hypsauchen]
MKGPERILKRRQSIKACGIASPQSPPTSPSQAPSPPQPPSKPQPELAYSIQSAYGAFGNPTVPRFIGCTFCMTQGQQAPVDLLLLLQYSKCVIIAGKVLLGGLATRNVRERSSFHPAYNFLIQHFSFIDIVYELVLMRALQGVRPPVFPTLAGFFGHLMAMVFSFSPAERRSMAEQYLFLLQDEALLLLDDIVVVRSIFIRIL